MSFRDDFNPDEYPRGTWVHVEWLDSCAGDGRWMGGQDAKAWHREVAGAIHHTLGIVWAVDVKGVTVVQSYVDYTPRSPTGEGRRVSCPLFIPTSGLLNVEAVKPPPRHVERNPDPAPPSSFDPPRRGFEEANQLIRDETNDMADAVRRATEQ